MGKRELWKCHKQDIYFSVTAVSLTLKNGQNINVPVLKTEWPQRHNFEVIKFTMAPSMPENWNDPFWAEKCVEQNGPYIIIHVLWVHNLMKISSSLTLLALNPYRTYTSDKKIIWLAQNKEKRVFRSILLATVLTGPYRTYTSDKKNRVIACIWLLDNHSITSTATAKNA